MRKSLLLSFVLLTHFTWSQNLVLNPDLETYSPCPSGIGSLESAANWFCPNTTCTSEYFNTCSTSPYSRVPKNYWGYEEPHCGNGYGGIYLWDASGLSYREYMVVKLADTLEAGQCYDLTFYVSLGNNCMLTTDAIGAKFRYTLDTNLYTTFPGMAPAHISNPTGTFFDTLGWTPVNGTYTATGGEKFLLIGNFEHDSSTDTLHYNTSASLNVIYVYI
ncbi:MAG TPA: hypothetical protein VK177_21180, partial [Flavobacteriales bacterium]|nr:hypothetical protein [Flavobacteriales bacterium]